MPRKVTRKPKPELRWDANRGAMVPDVTFDQGTRAFLAKICDAPGFIDGLQRWTGYFLAEQADVDTQPTSADIAKTFDDLIAVTDAFLERLQNLGGHTVMDIIDHEWYLRKKEFPPHPSELLEAVRRFRLQVAVGDYGKNDYVQITKSKAADPIRNLFTRVREVMEAHGVEPIYGASGNLANVVELCLESVGHRRYLNSLGNYIPRKK